MDLFFLEYPNPSSCGLYLPKRAEALAEASINLGNGKYSILVYGVPSFTLSLRERRCICLTSSVPVVLLDPSTSMSFRLGVPPERSRYPSTISRFRSLKNIFRFSSPDIAMTRYYEKRNISLVYIYILDITAMGADLKDTEAKHL